jgi:outer membrane protein assembly factor BamB
MWGSLLQRRPAAPAGRSTATLLFVLATVLLWAPATAGGAPRTSTVGWDQPMTGGTSRADGPSPNSSAYDWTTFQDGPLHNGYASNSPLTAATAGRLGVRWSTDLYAPSLDSPVVYYDPKLGDRIAYVGNEHGDLIAVDMADGHIVWSRWLGSAIAAAPVVDHGAVFVGTVTNSHIFKLDASTGALDCTLAAPNIIEGSPVSATPPGGERTVYFGTDGPVMAVNERDCALEWSFRDYAVHSGTWDPEAYALDAAGVPLVLFGSADPDSAVYAVNAVTGSEVWRFAAYNPSPHLYDVGAGVTVSPPGRNGFAGGVAYVGSKYGIMYALNLTTGAEIWSHNFTALGHAGTISTASLAGENLVFGDAHGLVDLNPLDGELVWDDTDPARAKQLSSPSIAGKNAPIVATADIAGGFDVVSLANGASLYHYETSGYITSSPAVSDGDIVIASTDGFLYDFAVGGGNPGAVAGGSGLPSASITEPSAGEVLSNNGRVEVQGGAGALGPLAQVVVAIQSAGSDGPWWSAAGQRWVPGPAGNEATPAAPKADSSPWSFSFPVPVTGGVYQATVYAVQSSGLSGVKTATVSFIVSPKRGRPRLATSRPFVAPGSDLTVTGTGFAPHTKLLVRLPNAVLGTARTSAVGDLGPLEVTIPPTEAVGPVALSVTGSAKQQSAVAVLTVANSWAQSGYDAEHTGYEPNDDILGNLITPGSHIYVKPAWHEWCGAAIASGPIVADGLAYVGTSDGTVVAVDVTTGHVRWLARLPSTGPVGGLAVDTSRGLVFATDGRSLDALSTAAGRSKWTDDLSGSLFAPALVGRDLYVSSTSGTVASLDNETGRANWSIQLEGTGAAAPPAVDPAAHLVVVSEAAGRLVALVSRTGELRWVDDVGAMPLGPPTIAAGRVYVGAKSDVIAVAEMNGRRLWTYATSGQVTGAPVLTASISKSAPRASLANERLGALPDILVGDSNGNVYELQGDSGAPTWKLSVGTSAVLSLAASRQVTFFTMADGETGAAYLWDQYVWGFAPIGKITTPPVIVDGTAYFGDGAGILYAFTAWGNPPIN